MPSRSASVVAPDLTGLSQPEGVAACETALDGHRDRKVCTTNASSLVVRDKLPAVAVARRPLGLAGEVDPYPLAALIPGWKFKIITAPIVPFFVDS